MYRLAVLIFASVFTLTGCGGGEDGGDDDGIDPVSNTSHNAGTNCMTCHVEDGEDGATPFTVAGTVYRSSGAAQTNATVNLYINGTNTLSGSIETDDSGNFYTTEVIEGLYYGGDLVSGVDVEIVTSTGTANMPGRVTDGACNACHGDSVRRITAN